jgi:yeast amino acid transporter
LQGHSIEELPFQAMGGVYGSWFGVVLVVLVLIGQFYVVRLFAVLEHGNNDVDNSPIFLLPLQAIFPVGPAPPNAGAVAESFFEAYLAAPVVILFWLGGYLWKRTLPRKASEIDLDVRSLSHHVFKLIYWHRPEGRVG